MSKYAGNPYITKFNPDFVIVVDSTLGKNGSEAITLLALILLSA